MPNNLLISYEIDNDKEREDKVKKSVEMLGNSTPLFSGTWYVNSPHTVNEAVKHVSHFMTDQDKLVILNSSNDECVWYNLSNSQAQRIRQNWKM
jgi:hypothetical protein